MGGKQPSTTTQISKVELPAWVDSASQKNYALAEQIASRPYEAYNGKTVADQSALTKQAQGMLASGTIADQTGYNQASDLFNKAAGGSAYTSSAADLYKKIAGGSSMSGEAADLYRQMAGPNANQTKAAALFDKAGQGILGLDRNAYMNPFQQSVIDSTVQTSKDALSSALMGNADKAVAAKAFGGDRSAIVDSQSIAQNNKDLAALVAGLNSDNYNQATSAMQGDIGNFLNAGGALAGLGAAENAQLGSAASGLSNLGQQEMAGWSTSASGLAGMGQNEVNNWLAAASGLSGNQTAANKDKLAQVSGLLTAGAQDQAYQQNLLDDQKGRWDEEKNHDLDQLNLLLASLGMSPYGQTQNTQTTQQGGSNGADFATMGMGFLSLLFGLSDERAKTDKKKVGTKIVRGKKVPIYTYRYIGQPKGTNKVRGPMAQDVEKVLPESVIKVGGMRMVDKRVLGALAR